MKTQIIADFCSNHLGDRRLMEEGIKRLAEIGVDYVKFQTFSADNLNPEYPDYTKMYQYYKSVQLSKEDHFFIIQSCNKYGIKPLFTAFGLDEAKMLKEIGMDIVKIASPDADKWDLVEYCVDEFQETIISTGMINKENFAKLKKEYKEYAIFLYCISKYPTKHEDIDFNMMQLFDGFSDHTEDIKASLAAINLSMPYIERHFTLGKDLPGKDHKISSTVDEFKHLVAERDYVASIAKYKNRWRSNNEPS